MAAMASLVQDVWLGWEPRLRALRLAPWDEPRVRLVFHLDAGVTLDDGRLAAFLETMAEGLEVIAWEPRGQGASGGRFGPEVLDDARRLVSESASRWGSLPLVVGGHGLGGWLALALAGTPGVAAAFALAPSLAGAGDEPSSPLRAALVNAFARPSVPVPTLVVEGRERPAAEAEAVSQWLARDPRGSRLVTAGTDADVLLPPWPATVAAWAEAAGTAGERARVIGRPLAHRLLFPVAVVFALLAAGTLGYQLVEGWGWFDALYMTAITITTVGFLEVHPMGAGGRVFTMALALGGVFTAFYAAAEFIRAVVTGEIRHRPRETAHGESPREAERPLRRLRLRPHGPPRGRGVLLGRPALRGGGPRPSVSWWASTSPTASPSSATPPRTTCSAAPASSGRGPS